MALPILGKSYSLALSMKPITENKYINTHKHPAAHYLPEFLPLHPLCARMRFT